MQFGKAVMMCYRGRTYVLVALGANAMPVGLFAEGARIAGLIGSRWRRAVTAASVVFLSACMVAVVGWGAPERSDLLHELVAGKWGEDRVVLPTKTRWVYTVRKGETLSGLAKRFRVHVSALVSLNAIADPNLIRVAQQLVIPEPRPDVHMPSDAERVAMHRLLCEQLADPDTGEPVLCADIGKFSRQIIARNGLEQEEVRGADGRVRRLSRVRIRLGKQHLRVRAQRFYPLVLEQAKRFGHDPALIMAMVHTESAFNPMAASASNAYGLMQLVPAAGAREAYRWLHHKDIAPSPSYLLRPRENIELGAAYLKLLQERTFKGVEDPESRLYCAVAAYNGGGGRVGRAFTGLDSVRASLPSINAAAPAQVLRRLKSHAPSAETRQYIQRVFERAQLYCEPAWPRD